jgi:hypothetical protein
MELLGKVPHIKEVVMDASLFDEGALACRDELTH